MELEGFKGRKADKKTCVQKLVIVVGASLVLLPAFSLHVRGTLEKKLFETNYCHTFSVLLEMLLGSVASSQKEIAIVC